MLLLRTKVVALKYTYWIYHNSISHLKFSYRTLKKLICYILLLWSNWCHIFMFFFLNSGEDIWQWHQAHSKGAGWGLHWQRHSRDDWWGGPRSWVTFTLFLKQVFFCGVTFMFYPFLVCPIQICFLMVYISIVIFNLMKWPLDRFLWL